MMPASESVRPAPTKARPRREQSSKRTHLALTGCWTAPALPQQVGDDLGGRPPGELGLARGHEPVGEHGDGQRLDVVRDDVVAPLEGGLGPAARSRCSPARGEAPRRNAVVERDRVTRSTMYRTAGLACTCVTAATTRLMVSASVTAVRCSSGTARCGCRAGSALPGAPGTHRDPRHEAVPLGLGEG